MGSQFTKSVDASTTTVCAVALAKEKPNGAPPTPKPAPEQVTVRGASEVLVWSEARYPLRIV
jgi:hypothetical protein